MVAYGYTRTPDTPPNAVYSYELVFVGGKNRGSWRALQGRDTDKTLQALLMVGSERKKVGPRQVRVVRWYW